MLNVWCVFSVYRSGLQISSFQDDNFWPGLGMLWSGEVQGWCNYKRIVNKHWALSLPDWRGQSQKTDGVLFMFRSQLDWQGKLAWQLRLFIVSDNQLWAESHPAQAHWQCRGWSLLVEKRISWEWRRWHVPHCNVWWTRPETVSKHEIASEILSILGLRCFYSDFRSNVTQRRVRSNADQGKHKESSSHWHSSVTLYYYCCCEGTEEESFTALTNMKQLSWRLWAVGGNIDYFSIWK